MDEEICSLGRRIFLSVMLFFGQRHKQTHPFVYSLLGTLKPLEMTTAVDLGSTSRSALAGRGTSSQQT